MRTVVFGVATAVAGAAVTWIVFTASASLPSAWRWVVVSATGVLALIASWFAIRRVAPVGGPRISVGSRIRGKDVTIEDVSIRSGKAGDVTIGADIHSEENTSIRRIELGGDPDNDD